MKRRITFIQREDAAFDPQQAVLTASSLSVRDLDAAREERITVELDQLSEQVENSSQTPDQRTEDSDSGALVSKLVARYPRELP